MLFKIDIRNSLTETFYCDSFSRFFEVSFYGSTTMSLDLVPNPSVVPTSVEARHIYPQQHSNHQSVEHFPPSHLDDQVLISLMITVNSVSMVIMRAGPTYQLINFLLSWACRLRITFVCHMTRGVAEFGSSSQTIKDVIGSATRKQKEVRI